MTHESRPKAAPAIASFDFTTDSDFDLTLSGIIDRAEVQAHKARDLGWSGVAQAFEKLRGELVDLAIGRAAR